MTYVQRRRALVAAGILATLVVAGCGDDGGDEASWPQFRAEDRVYDLTQESLTIQQIEELQARAVGLEQSLGADVVMVVRELDADPDDTLEQAEDLQSAWVEQTGAPEDTTVAVLINREPGSDDEARAGIVVGSTFEDGNVSTGELEDVVEDDLIPPLGEGDVAGSLFAGLGGFEGAARSEGDTSGSPWAREAGAGPTGWLVWVPVLVALGFLGLGLALRGDRHVPRSVRKPAPSTSRPEDVTPPAIGAALAKGDVEAAGYTGTVLDLVRRGAIEMVPEPKGTWGQEAAGIRLLDAGRVADPLGEQAWAALEARAQDGVVSGKDVGKVLADGSAHRQLTRDLLDRAGYRDPVAARRRTLLAVAGAGAAVVAVGVLVLAAFAESFWVLTGVGALLVVSVILFLWTVHVLPFTQEGLQVSGPWRAYLAGLQQAAPVASAQGVEASGVDLDQAFPDILALDLGSTWKGPLEEAEKAGIGLRYLPDPALMSFPIYSIWLTQTTSTTTVSGTTVSGGGGAAGST